jgi:uncharacterized membrane protein HdeD (DUF308 family)
VTMVARTPDAAQVRARWKLYFGFGVVFVILGIVALGNLVSATLVTTAIIGLVLVIAGFVQVAGALTTGAGMGRVILSGLLGILYVIVGVDIMADPTKGAITLTVVVSVMLVFGGLLRIVGAVMEQTGHRVVNAIVGVISILLGGWLFSGIPTTGVAIGLFVGLELVMAGVAWMFLAWAARKAPTYPEANR